MPVIANDADLERLVRKLGEIESGQALRGLALNIGEEAIQLVREGFDEERDPYGTAWKPLTYRDGRILRDRGVMLNSLHLASADASGAVIEMGVWYAIVHQEGRTITPNVAKALRFMVYGKPVYAQSVTVPARPFFPRENDLPSSWVSAFDEVTEEWFDMLIGNG